MGNRKGCLTIQSMMTDDKKSYPLHSEEDKRFKNQDEFDNALMEDKKAMQDAKVRGSNSEAPPDPDFRDVNRKKEEE